jgi:hypothetical protein
MAVEAGLAVRATEDERWEMAKRIAGKLKPLPIAFTSSVRLLALDHINNNGELRPVTKFQVARIFRSSSFKGMLYQATLELHNKDIRDLEFVSVGEMMNHYKAGDLAALIGMFVFFKKVRRIVSDQDWDLLRNDIVYRIQAGAAAGVALPKVGVGAGVLMGAMPLLTIGSMYPYNNKGFTEYRRHLQKSDYEFDAELEVLHWSCTAAQVASLSMSQLGFGVDMAEAVLRGWESTPLERLNNEIQLDYRMARLWLEAFLKCEDQPMSSVPGEYFPLAEDRTKAEHAMGCLIDGYRHWFELTPDDVSRELTPKLFPPIDEDSEIPADLQEVFSIDEITEMGERDFDDLIDQIDMEQAGEVAMGGTTMSTDALESLDDLAK